MVLTMRALRSSVLLPSLLRQRPLIPLLGLLFLDFPFLCICHCHIELDVVILKVQLSMTALLEDLAYISQSETLVIPSQIRHFSVFTSPQRSGSWTISVSRFLCMVFVRFIFLLKFIALPSAMLRRPLVDC